EIHVQPALPVADAEFRLGAEVDRADVLPARRIDDAGGLRVAVEREDVLRRRIVEYRVIIVRGVRATQDLEGPEVEHHDGTVASRCREAVARALGEGNAMRAVQSRDLLQHLAGSRVHHHHAVLPCNEQPVTDSVERQIVPAAITAECEGVLDMVARAGVWSLLCLHQGGARKCKYYSGNVHEQRRDASGSGHVLSGGGWPGRHRGA